MGANMRRVSLGLAGLSVFLGTSAGRMPTASAAARAAALG